LLVDISPLTSIYWKPPMITWFFQMHHRWCHIPATIFFLLESGIYLVKNYANHCSLYEWEVQPNMCWNC
jgi:hypothetical protein